MITSWKTASEVLRISTMPDLAHFVALLADPEVGRWLWFTPAPAAMFESYFTPLIEAQTKKLAAGEMPTTVVFSVENDDGAFLGQGAVVAVENSPGGFEIGFQLRKETWGQGVGTRLADFLCAYAIHQCAAFRIEANCLEGNVGSRTILTKLGLEIEGIRIDSRLKENKRHTELLFGARVSQLDADHFELVALDLGVLQR